MGAVLVALSLLAATAGVPWLHGADGTHVHHAAATDACHNHGPHHDHRPCHGHADPQREDVSADGCRDTDDEDHRHEGHDEHDAPVEDGPAERDGSCVTCVQLHLLTFTPPAPDPDRVPTARAIEGTRERSPTVASASRHRVWPPGRGPPASRVG
jgi:hypothetical protein